MAVRLLYLLRKRRKFFPQNSDLSSLCLIVLLCSAFAPSLYFVLLTPFTLSHRSEPPSRATSYSLRLHQETISLLQNCTPQNHIGFTLRSLSHPRYITTWVIQPSRNSMSLSSSCLSHSATLNTFSSMMCSASSQILWSFSLWTFTSASLTWQAMLGMRREAHRTHNSSTTASNTLVALSTICSTTRSFTPFEMPS